MNVSGNIITSETINSIIQDTYAADIYNRLFFGSTILLFYATLLRLSQEIEHIWSKSFSLPTWLYMCARYGALAQQGLELSVNFVPLGRACDILINASNFFSVLAFIGIQGLLVARAYALYQHKIPTMVLAFSFLSSLILQLYVIVSQAGCLTSISPTAKAALLLLGLDLCYIVNDVVIFSICMWKVWGTWKLKHEAGIQSKHSLVSVLVTQSILRLCFVIVISITAAVLSGVAYFSVFFTVISGGFRTFQNTLSSILVADFILDLRSLNAVEIEASTASLPPLQFSNVLRRIHQSFVVELATPGNINVEGSDDYDHESPGYTDDIQPAQGQDISTTA